MTRSIADWQRLAHALARERGEHSRACVGRKGTDAKPDCGPYCGLCNGSGRVDVDHKSPTRIASRLALIHLAISRAVECVEEGEMELYYCDPIVGCSNGTYVVGPKRPVDLCHGPGEPEPKGFPIALADVFLRLCDLAESVGVVLADFPGDSFPVPQAFTQEELLTALKGLHGAVARCDEHRLPAGPTNTNDLNSLLYELQGFAAATSVDMFAAAELKYTYEKGRAK